MTVIKLDVEDECLTTNNEEAPGKTNCNQIHPEGNIVTQHFNVQK